jgi:two-component system, sensor histidine kinase
MANSLNPLRMMDNSAPEAALTSAVLDDQTGRAARRRRPWRAGQSVVLLIALVVGLFAATAGVLSWTLISVRQQYGTPGQDVIWTLFQFEAELQQTQNLAQKLLWQGSKHADSVRLRYEILLSRVDLLLEGDAGHHLGALLDDRASLMEIVARTAALEPRLVDAIADVPMARDQLVTELDALTADARRFALLAQERHNSRIVSERHGLMVSTGLSLWLIGALAVAVGALVITIIRQLGRERATALRQARISDELRFAKLRAEAANKAKSAFLTNMSHELRTPLNAIIGITEMTLEDLQSAGLHDEAAGLQRVERAGRHLLALINDLLDLSKIEAGKLELMPTEFQIDDIVLEVRGLGESLAQRHPNTFSIDNGLGRQRVILDYVRAKQILFNLVGNAFRFTENGHIHVVFATCADGIRIDIRDSGIGIAADKLGSLFQDFVQLDITRRQGGSGLGLALSRRLARMMGGDVGVTSEPGKGSVFTVFIPGCLAADTPPRPLL